MEFITAHWVEIGVIALATLKIAETAARWTETTKDDEIIAKIKSVVTGVFEKKSSGSTTAP